MIKVHDLKKTYFTGRLSVDALKGISFHVQPGEFTAIMGPSGSGKSTLMNLLGLLDRPTAGSYILNDIETAGMNEKELAKERNKKIGFVFQTFNLLSRLTAQKNVELPLIYGGVSPKERVKRAAEALERVGLKDRAHHFPNELSGGQNQRVAIARALVNRPSVILADEPTGALDTRTGEEIMAIFQELHREGATIILVTHEAEISRHAERILRFRDGLLVNDEFVESPINAEKALSEFPAGGDN